MFWVDGFNDGDGSWLPKEHSVRLKGDNNNNVDDDDDGINDIWSARWNKLTGLILIPAEPETAVLRPPIAWKSHSAPLSVPGSIFGKTFSAVEASDRFSRVRADDKTGSANSVCARSGDVESSKYASSMAWSHEHTVVGKEGLDACC